MMSIIGACGSRRFAILVLLVGLGEPAWASEQKPSPAPASPPVVLLETGAASGGVTLADFGHPDVSIPLHWVEKNGKTLDIRLEVTPLDNGRGNGVLPTIMKGAASAPQLIRLEARGMQGVSLNARLLDAGIYRALLRATVIDGGKETALDPVPITVIRTHTVPAVEFTTASALPVEVPWFGNSVKATPKLSAYTSGNAITLPVPYLAQSTRRSAVDASEGTATPMSLSDPASGAATTRVEPGRPTPLAFTLSDLKGSGRYDAVVRFASAGYKPLDAKLVVFVREPATLAFFFVFVGVLISFVIQLWGTVIQPARELRLRVAKLLESVETARRQAGPVADDPDVRGLLKGVETSLGQRASARWYERPQVAASLDVFDTIVPALETWISLWGQLGQVHPASVRALHRATLIDARQKFIANMPDPAQVQAAVQALDQMPEKIRTDVATALAKSIGDLDASLAADPRQAMVAVRLRLQSAADRLTAGQVEAAIGIYDQAVRDYVAEMAKTLSQRAGPAQPTPPGLDPAEWQELTEQTRAALAGIGAPQDVDAALEQLRQATRAYVQGFSAGLLRALAGKGDDVSQPVEAAAAKVDQALQANDLVGAWRALDEEQVAYAGAQALAGQPMGRKQQDDLSEATRAPGGTLDTGGAFDLPGWWARLSRPGSAERIAHRTFLGDLGVSAVVLAVAGLTGVLTLWAPNPVWGGPLAYLAAVLMGFAADRFTQAAVAAFKR